MRALHVAVALIGVVGWQSSWAAQPLLGISARPAEALIDETPAIVVSGAAPGARLRVTAELTDDGGTRWLGSGEYFANLAGTIDLSKAASLAGTYCGVDGRGLFWSMLPVELAGLASRCGVPAEDWQGPASPTWKDPLSPIQITLTVAVVESAKQPAATARATYRALRMAPGVRVTKVSEGRIRGMLFEPADAKDSPVALVFTGSGGGVSANNAALLASRGITAFALAYFNYEDLPREHVNVPLEYFREGIEWVQRRTGRERVAVMGASRGGEAALLVAATYPKLVSAVVAMVSVHVVYGGIKSSLSDMYTVPAWTLNGRVVPYAGAAPGTLPAPGETRMRATFRPLYLRAWSPQFDERYAIRVERIEAPVLLLSAGGDELWPSAIGSEKIVARLKAHAFSYPVEHIAYEGAGHAISQPATLVYSLGQRAFHPAVKSYIPIGGTPEASSAATLDGVARAISWIKRHARSGGGAD